MKPFRRNLDRLNAVVSPWWSWLPTTAKKEHVDEFGRAINRETYYRRGEGYVDNDKPAASSMRMLLSLTFGKSVCSVARAMMVFVEQSVNGVEEAVYTIGLAICERLENIEIAADSSRVLDDIKRADPGRYWAGTRLEALTPLGARSGFVAADSAAICASVATRIRGRSCRSAAPEQTDGLMVRQPAKRPRSS